MRYQKNFGRFYVESLEERRVLSAVPFTAIDLESPPELRFSPYSASRLIGDMNGDGNLDIVAAYLSAWHFEMFAGSDDGTFEAPVPIGSFLGEISFNGQQAELIDYDVDGDLDVMVAKHNEVIVFENSDGQGTLVKPLTIEGLADDVRSVDAFWVTDVDSDGRSDLLISYPFPREEMVVYRNDADTGFTTPQAIDVQVSQFFGFSFGVGKEAIVITDIDSDGDEDLVYPNRSNGISIASNSEGTFETVDLPLDEVRTIDAFNVADYDGDGDLDIMVLHHPRSVKVIENDLASGSFLPKPSQQVFGFWPPFIAEAGSADLDHDGDAELVVRFSDTGPTHAYEIGDDYLLTRVEVANVRFRDLAFGQFDVEPTVNALAISEDLSSIRTFEMIDGRVEPTRVLFDSGGVDRPTSPQFVDWDADNDLDVVVLAPSKGELLLYEYDAVDQSFADRKVIVEGLDDAQFSRLFDLDRDGDLDVLLADNLLFDSVGHRIGWLEQVDGAFSSLQNLATIPISQSVGKIVVTDIDGDKNLDITFSVKTSNQFNPVSRIEWLHGLGEGAFADSQVITTDVITEFVVADVDGAGNLDVVTQSSEGNPVVMLGDPEGFRRTIGPVFAYGTPTIIASGDLTGNGIDDVVYAASDRRYFERRVLTQDGAGEWNPLHLSVQWDNIFPSSAATDVLIVDVNNDGHQDIMTTGLEWFENAGDGELFLSPRDVVFTPNRTLDEIIAADFDRDGDIDILSFSTRDDQLIIFRNELVSTALRGDFDLDGRIAAADIDTLGQAIRNRVGRPEYDINLDGKVDQEDRLSFVRDIAMTTAGDSNLDGRFDSTDLILIMRSARYEKPDVEGTWETGDFDGDGRFGTSDLVAAFRSGAYVA